MIKIKKVEYIEYDDGVFNKIFIKKIPRIGYNNTNTAIVRKSLDLISKRRKLNYMNLYDKNNNYIIS